MQSKLETVIVSSSDARMLCVLQWSNHVPFTGGIVCVCVWSFNAVESKVCVNTVQSGHVLYFSTIDTQTSLFTNKNLYSSPNMLYMEL